jgi:hypothetical protein
MTRPTVVDEGLDVDECWCEVDVVGVSGMEEVRERVKLNWFRLMWKRCGCEGVLAWRGRESMRYMRMKPEIRETPTQAWGLRSVWSSPSS